MRKLTAVILFLLCSPALANVSLSGSVKDAQGNALTVDGTIWFTVSQNANINVGGGCGGPGQVATGIPIIFSMTAGTIAGGANIVGNDCLTPVTTYYKETVFSNSGSILVQRNVTITGASADIGTLPPAVSPSNPSGNMVPFTRVLTAVSPICGGGDLSADRSFSLCFAVPIANGGTNQSSAFTNGSIIYSNGTSLTQDNPSLFYDASNKWVILNNTAPIVTGLNSTTRLISLQGSIKGLLELASTSADADGAVAGDISWAKSSNTTNKQLAVIEVAAEGATANDRGGRIQFFTKPNAGSIGESARLDSTGKLFVGPSGGTAPAVAFDTTGALATREATAISIANAANNDVAVVANTGFVRFTGGGASATVTGIAAGANGQELSIVNATGSNINVRHDNAGSTAANRLYLVGAADTVLATNTAAKFKYNSTLTRWVGVGAFAASAGGYATVQEEGGALTQRATLNFIGAAITAADNGGSARTDVTLSQSPASTSVVGTGRTITTTAPITIGGGASADLSADRTVAISITTTNDGGAVVKQASSPGTQQTSANANVSGNMLAGGFSTTGSAPAETLDVGTSLQVAKIDGLMGPQRYAMTTTPAAVANTTTGTAFAKTFSIPANYLRVGSLIRIRAAGVYSTTGTPTLDIQLRVGGTSKWVLQTGTITTPSGAALWNWVAEGFATVRAIGAGGTFFADGGSAILAAATSGTWAAPVVAPNTRSGGISVATNGALTADVLVQWGTASPSNTITMENFTVEIQHAYTNN